MSPSPASRRTPLVLSLLAALVIASGVRGDTIRLKASVRLAPGADVVRLADVAELSGSEAEQYADLAIATVTSPASVIEVPIADVRAVLTRAGAHWGRLNLSGRAVIVRPGRRPEAAAAPRPMSGASLVRNEAARTGDRGAEPSALAASALVGQRTLGGSIARHMVAALGLAPGDLRLAFDGRDLAWLETAEDEPRRFELVPESSPHGDRVTITIRAWTGGSIERTGRLTFRPLLLTRAAVLKQKVARETSIDPSAFEIQERWLPPLQAAQVCPPGEAAGRWAARSLHEGETIGRREVRRPTLIERGDRVTVRCRVGGLVISLLAEARADGVEGEEIEFRKLGERENFLATVVGRGEAVVDLGRTGGASTGTRTALHTDRKGTNR